MPAIIQVCFRNALIVCSVIALFIIMPYHIFNDHRKTRYIQEECMKKLSVCFVVILLFSFAAPAVFAEQGPVFRTRTGNDHHDKFFDRIKNQQKRIDQGIKSGELTREESAMLQDNLEWIKGKYSRMKSDNILTKQERERLEKMLDQNSEMIKNKKHNPAKRLYDDNIESRIDNQQKRIDRGVKSGELTRREAEIVQDNLNEIRRRYSKMRRDGVLTMKESEKLERMLDENSRMITREKHNKDLNIRRLF
jgi:hypothetical protein